MTAHKAPLFFHGVRVGSSAQPPPPEYLLNLQPFFPTKALVNGLRYRRGGLARLPDIMAENLETRAVFSGRISPVRVHALLASFYYSSYGFEKNISSI